MASQVYRDVIRGTFISHDAGCDEVVTKAVWPGGESSHEHTLGGR